MERLTVGVAGGGPAGLALAMLWKRIRPDDAVTVFERGRADETYGWGITLPRRTLALLEPADPEAAAMIAERSRPWDRIEVHHRGRRVEMSGTRLIGISRHVLLEILQARCRAVGVDLRFESSVDPAAFPAYDLVVAADGAQSAWRTAFADEFGAIVTPGRNRYTWLATPHLFTGLAFCVAESDAGPFAGHGYPFAADKSTFVVECDPDTWQRAALGERSNVDACAYLAGVFADALGGEPLVFGRGLRWQSFTHVTVRHWRHRRIVLLGDAAHALHFSIGSGTMLALEDAIALTDCLAESADLEAALEAFDRERPPCLEPFYELERTMIGRLERLTDLLPIEPLDLAYILLSR